MKFKKPQLPKTTQNAPVLEHKTVDNKTYKEDTTLGLDLSLNETGYVVGDANKILAHGVIDALGYKGLERLRHVKQKIKEILDSGIDFVVLEGFSYGSKGSSVDEIYALGWFVRELLYEYNTSYIVASPGQLKKFATGKGNSKKEDIKLAVYKRWGQEFDTNDETDAYVMLEIGRAYKGTSKKLISSQIEVIKKIRAKENK